MAQGDLCGKAILPKLATLAPARSAGVFAVPMPVGDVFQGLGLPQKLDPFIQPGVRFGFADKNETLAIRFGNQLT